MWQTIQLGFDGCVNPFILSTALLYLSLLTHLRHTRWQLITSGFVYIFVVWLVNFFVLSGSYDHLIYRSFMPTLISMFYSVLAVLFYYTGWLHFVDWRCYREHQDVTMFRLCSSRVLDFSTKTKQLLYVTSFFFLFIFVAWCATLAEARLAQNYFVFVIVQQMIKQDGGLLMASTAFAFYMFAYSIVLILIWSAHVVDSVSMRFKSLLNRFMAFEKLVYAALYWAVAMGLMYFLLNVVRF